MARRKPKKEDKPKYTPASVAKDYCVNYEDAHFAVLVVCGFSYAEAYRLAFHSNGTTASVASMASKKVRDISVQRVLSFLRDLYWMGELSLRDDYALLNKFVSRYSPARELKKRERAKALRSPKYE